MPIILADVGIPMIMLQWPAMVVLLLPVIAVEAFVIRRELGISSSEAFRGVSRANIASTLLGVPLAWILMLAVQFGTYYVMDAGRNTTPVKAFDELLNRSAIIGVASVPLRAAWVGDDDICIVLVAAAMLLIPSFFLSVWIERIVCRDVWRNLDVNSVSRAVRKANCASYALLFTICMCFSIYFFPNYMALVRQWSADTNRVAPQLLNLSTNQTASPRLELQNN